MLLLYSKDESQKEVCAVTCHKMHPLRSVKQTSSPFHTSFDNEVIQIKSASR
jgi:hypothetical protein